MKSLFRIALVALSAVLPNLLHAQLIQIDGSSTVYPISKVVAEGFQRSKQGAVKVTINISGTSGGFRKFCRGETDINDASRPILKPEMQACSKAGVQYIEMAVAFDALTVVVNPRNDWVNSFTVAELKKIWEPAARGKIMYWNQVRAKWPNHSLKLFSPGDDSGTFDYFTEAIVGKAGASRSDFFASEDDNVLVEGVARDRDALSYFGYAYYVNNQKKLKAVPIDNGKGPVAPSPKTVENGTYQPLSRPIFIYAARKSLDRPEVREFIAFYLTRAPQFVKQVKYIPLPASGYTLGIERVKNRKFGTLFGGESAIGITIDDLLKREARIQ
jgi:phosphate transport system substrate-binding protein